MEKVLKTESITNSKGNLAVIFHVNSVVFDSRQIIINYDRKRPINHDEIYRVYFWIDDEVGSLGKCIKDFEILFERYGISCGKYASGNRFNVVSCYGPKDPREGQDGGVVGINCP